MLDYQALWNQALNYHDYVAASTQHRGLWEGIYRLARVPEWAHLKIPDGEQVRLLALAEDWCGDASNTIPIIARWTEAVPGMELRVLRRDEHPEMMDRYLTDGTRSIPIVVLLNREFQELGHWGPRPKALQEFVLERLGKVPKGELYPQTRRWYAKDHGETTIREILDVLNPS